MNLGLVSGLTPVIALLVGCGTVVAGFVRAAAWFNNWITDDRIKHSLDRQKSGLEVAQLLEAIGEPFWAAEARERAWMEVLRRLARLEVNRSRPVRFLVAYVGWLLYFAAVGLAIASRANPWLGVAGVVCLFAAVGVGVWWFATKPGFERAVTERAKEKYERHKCEGRITRADGTHEGGEHAA
jgi:hypothetical protein